MNSSSVAYRNTDLLSKFVEGFAFLCALSLLIVVLFNESAALFFVVLVYVCFVLCVIHVLATQKIFLSPLFFAFLISIGYILKPAVQIADKGSAALIGWEAVGTFGFSFDEMTGLFFVIVCGLSGVMAALFIVTAYTRDGMRAILSEQDMHAARAHVRIKLVTILWIILFLFLTLFMWKHGIGKHGFMPGEEQRLPFKLLGVMVYLRNTYFPAVAFVIMDYFIFKKRYRAVMIIFFILVVLLTVVSMTSFIRGLLIVPITLFIIFLIRNYRSFKLRLFHLFLLCALVMIILFSLMSVIGSVRSELYSSGMDTPGVSIATIKTHVSNFNFQEVLTLVNSTLTSRVEGTRELMAVYSSPLSGLGVFREAFFSTDHMLFDIVYGFSLVSEGRAYGVTVGMLGLLFLSKSHVVVFIGSFLYSILFLAIEYFFIKRGYRMTGFYLAALFAVMIWANMVWWFLTRMLAMTVLVYITIGIIEKKRRINRGALLPENV